ncbi:MAG TPA: hypothetical protein VII75_03750 [Thermoanaerobaculia bacterium]|nr:hypothetical protein [Thermoanaerobaculia bacterium]
MIRKSGLVVGLLFICHTAGAAIQYEFQQITRSDISNQPGMQFTGRAILDGDRSRVDIVSGNAYTPGTFVLSTNGSRTMSFVDPMRKVYVEVNAGSVAAAVGASNINIDNLNSSANKMDDHPVIAGVPTDHYRLTLTYDITLMMGTIVLRQSVHTTIDKWTTVMFGDVNETFLANSSIRTGNPKLDEIIQLETTKIKGFPLRETTQTVTTDMRSAGSSALAQSGFSRTRTQTRDMTITSIRQMQPDANAFIVPASYHKAESGDEKLAQTQVQTLSMEP